MQKILLGIFVRGALDLHRPTGCPWSFDRLYDLLRWLQQKSTGGLRLADVQHVPPGLQSAFVFPGPLQRNLS